VSKVTQWHSTHCLNPKNLAQFERLRIMLDGLRQPGKLPSPPSMKSKIETLWFLSAFLLLAGCATNYPTKTSDTGLIGSWRSRIQFTSGAFASIKDLEFMYVFNTGGTMTESSNYDGAPPVPPAYGVWRKVGPCEFEAKYVFYSTKSPGKFEDIATGGGWLPSGCGVFTEKIRIASDGKRFQSKIRYEAFDPAGRPVDGGGAAEASGERIAF